MCYLSSRLKPLFTKLEGSPALVRVAPFALFLLLTLCQEQFDGSLRYWLYLAKTLLGAWMMWVVRRRVPEMRWAFNLEAVIVGVFVFAVWVGLDPWYPKLGKAGSPWNPHLTFGQDSLTAWAFAAVRILGSTLVVPLVEEVFYRSFFYRFIINSEFRSVVLGKLSAVSFIVTSALFGMSHHEWLAGILCGLAYQGLVCWKNRLGDAITAHAITNLLLGCWVVWKGAWHFW